MPEEYTAGIPAVFLQIHLPEKDVSYSQHLLPDPVHSRSQTELLSDEPEADGTSEHRE